MLSDQATHGRTILRYIATVLLLAASQSEPAQTAESSRGPILPVAEQFDGSFKFDNGVILTGGRFVEGGKTFWLYLDTDNSEVGAAFERVGETAVLRSLPPYGGVAPNPNIELKFRAGPRGDFDQVEWSQDGKILRGRRVFSHSSTPVRFTSPDGQEINGRLLEPQCAGPRPAIVAVHGSGPVDRYGGTYHLFFVREGMSVLAYDKRGYTSDVDEWTEPDIAEMAGDAAAAASYLAALPQTDSTRIGIMGSSQGGWTVPPAAEAAEDVDYLILRAGAALTETETYIHEVRQEWREEGLRGLDLDYATAFLREALHMAERQRPLSEVDELATPYVDSDWFKKAIGEGPVSSNWSKEWWQWAQRNMASTPIPSLARSDLPLIWFLAERDQNVPLVSTKAALERAFETSPSEDETIVIIRGAPHSFIVKMGTENAVLAPEFFQGMASWLEERGFSAPDCWKTGSK